jgi:hypothetical protein
MVIRIDYNAKIMGFCILFVPTAVMVSFIVWAVSRSYLDNQDILWVATPNLCVVKTNIDRFTVWMNDEDAPHNNLISVSGGAKLFLLIGKSLNQTCEDIWMT